MESSQILEGKSIEPLPEKEKGYDPTAAADKSAEEKPAELPYFSEKSLSRLGQSISDIYAAYNVQTHDWIRTNEAGDILEYMADIRVDRRVDHLAKAVKEKGLTIPEWLEGDFFELVWKQTRTIIDDIGSLISDLDEIRDSLWEFRDTAHERAYEDKAWDAGDIKGAIRLLYRKMRDGLMQHEKAFRM
jgi:hypothetical protein